MLTIHSVKPIAAQIEECVPGSRTTEYDGLVSTLLLAAQDSEEVEVKAGKYRLLQKFYQ